jgi:hypothetical protein
MTAPAPILGINDALPPAAHSRTAMSTEGPTDQQKEANRVRFETELEVIPSHPRRSRYNC